MLRCTAWQSGFCNKGFRKEYADKKRKGTSQTRLYYERKLKEKDKNRRGKPETRQKRQKMRNGSALFGAFAAVRCGNSREQGAYRASKPHLSMLALLFYFGMSPWDKGGRGLKGQKKEEKNVKKGMSSRHE